MAFRRLFLHKPILNRLSVYRMSLGGTCLPDLRFPVHYARETGIYVVHFLNPCFGHYEWILFNSFSAVFQ